MSDDLNNKALRFQGSDKNRLIKALRERLHVTEEMVSDEKILEITKGTLLRAGIELGLAFSFFQVIYYARLAYINGRSSA